MTKYPLTDRLSQSLEGTWKLAICLMCLGLLYGAAHDVLSSLGGVAR